MIEEIGRELEILHAKINRDSVIDPTWYRRDSPVYECVCYINTIVAAYYSANHEVMTVFLRRAHEWLTSGPKRNEVPEAARTRLLSYLTAVTRYLAAAETPRTSKPE